MLNDAIAKEIAVSIQYMWQHVQVIGVKGVAVEGQFKQTAIAEMKHAEKIAERLWYLEGTPTTAPAPIKVGESLREFLELDVKAEEEAITLYKRIIEQAQKKRMSPQPSSLKKSLKTKKNITTFLPPCSKRHEVDVGEEECCSY